jgi:hypothetical protein
MMLFAAFALAGIALIMTGGTGYARSAPHEDLAAMPLTASSTTPTESSMLIAMGHLKQPANTFWELFLRLAGKTSWVLDTPPGVASNGGLVASDPTAGPLTVGFFISADLKFSPVARASNGGTTWSGGELPAPLATTPDALAVGPTGETLALVGKADERIVTSGDLSTWHTVTTTKALAGATSTCAWQRVTAVAYTAQSQPLLGLACTRAGEIGILAPSVSSSVQPSGWRNIGPSLPAGVGAASVVRLDTTASGTMGLAQLGSATRTSLVAFWGQGSADQWSQSGALPVPKGWTVEATATGGGAGQGVAVLLGAKEQRRVEQVTGPGTPWVAVASPPPGASGVSEVGTEIDTFVVTGSDLAVWAWTPGSVGWRRTATIVVKVPYGSSS